MACRKLILNFKNIHGMYQMNILPIYLLNLKINSINSYQCVRPFYLNCTKFETHTNLDSVKSALDISEFKRQNFAGTRYVVQTLQKLLELSLAEARITMRLHPKLRKCTSEQVESNYKLYRERGITDEIIKKYPDILTLQDPKPRLELIRQLSVDLNKTAPLLTANFTVLRRMVREANYERSLIPHGSRIVHLSKILNVPEWEISEKLIKHHYIMRLPMGRLEKVLQILLDYGVEPKNVMSDFWALRYSPELAERRLQRAIDANVQKVKAWMIRCTDQVFERCINRQIENRKILGTDSSVEEYLSKRLECSVENAKYLTEKYPAIEKMNISKMKEMLDFLFEKGYTPGHVCRVPRILIHSLETTKSRLIQLKQLGYIPPSLAMLCKSKRDFDKYIKKYLKGGKNNVETKTKES